MKMNKVERILSAVSSYGHCDACNNRTNKMTPLEAPAISKASKIIIVVEAPNDNGELLSESARDFLGGLVEEIGANWSDFIIVGAFRCPLVKNSLFKVEDSIVYCRGRLRRIFSAIRPKAIVLMGRIPLAFFKSNESIGTMRGVGFEIPIKTRQGDLRQVPTVVTQHPNYYFKSGKNKKVFGMIADDLRIAMQKAGK